MESKWMMIEEEGGIKVFLNMDKVISIMISKNTIQFELTRQVINLDREKCVNFDYLKEAIINGKIFNYYAL